MINKCETALGFPLKLAPSERADACVFSIHLGIKDGCMIGYEACPYFDRYFASRNPYAHSVREPGFFGCTYSRTK